jgi:alpha-galactosidase
MAIIVQPTEGLFHLQGESMSYVIQILNDTPVHAYWGKRLRNDADLSQLADCDKHTGLDRLPQEYPQYGTGDFRYPAYQVKLEDGTRITELKYKSYTLSAGKKKSGILPGVYVETEDEADTLELHLEDAYSGLQVTLVYTLFKQGDVITRYTRIVNNSKASLVLQQALSMSVDFPAGDMDMVYLSGAWGREAQLTRNAVKEGANVIESRRGVSSHQLNPFAALVSPDADERRGEVYGFSFVYSGNFEARAEKDSFQSIRFAMGINSFDFGYVLEEGAEFETPEVVMVYSNQGLGEMSRIYHRIYRTRLCRGQYRDTTRPILVNNWEATYFDFTEEKLVDIATEASKLGIELFVLDDGWFGSRNSDNSSLGDWTVNPSKLPNGLNKLAERINDVNMKFGLWVEPEMISPDSDLYRAHPDWCLHVPDRRRTEFRWQLVLDYSRKEVRDYIYQSLHQIFSTVPISYVKWDMNRNLTEIGSADCPPHKQTEIAHRYVLGLYELLEQITSEFPHILFECCSSGGGRFDPGMLYYMPQTWTSDDSDGVERLKIQYGTSLVYPASSIGAHVSASPNHQVGRVSPITFRGDVAMSGNFGYELDLTALSEEEKEAIKLQVAQYKEINSIVQQGDLYRLKSPFEGNETAWMFVSENKQEAIVFYFRVLAQPNSIRRRVYLEGLDPSLNYKLVPVEGVENRVARYDGQLLGGDRLMQAGLIIDEVQRDFYSTWFRLKAE